MEGEERGGENLGGLGTICDVIESLLKEVVDFQWTNFIGFCILCKCQGSLNSY